MSGSRSGIPWRASLASLAVLALTACAAPSVPQTSADDARVRLFARAYDDVMDLYIERLTSRDVALPAFEHLSSIDSDFSVRPDGDDLVLQFKNGPAERLIQPPDRDARGWARLTSAVVTAGRRLSPKLAEASEDDLDKTLFSGITGTLDRFSRYLPPAAARDEEAAREGFGGIGITLEYDDAAVSVATIIPNSPADQAGLKLDDRIISIDDTPTSVLSRDEIVRRLRGPAGSHVDLTLRRSGERESLRKVLTRAYVVVPTVTARRDGATMILRVSGFNEHTTESLRQEFKRLRTEIRGPLRGIVLDLRGNPGGLLNQAASVSELFLPSGGRIVATVGRNPTSNQEFDVKRGDISEGAPMVVLVNGGSASSAEIVAAALQDSGRALVVGSTSYGKGTVQIVEHLPNDGELILTVARLVTPAGYVLHQHGIVPNLCTSGAGDDEATLAALLKRGSAAGVEIPRASLDEDGWARLRGTCPGEVRDRKIELEAAERLIADSTLYAHLTHGARPAVAGISPVHGGP